MYTINEFYSEFNEELRFQRHSRKIEYITTLKALTPFTSEPKTIIELGAGTGAYAMHYAKLGHTVTAVDLVPFNIEQIIEKIKLEPNLDLEAYVADATDLSMLEDDSYDVVLCLGPYYHIIDEQNRQDLISESLRILKPDGMLAIAYLNKYSVLPMLIKKEPHFFNAHTINQVINKGFIDGQDERSFWIQSHYTSPQEIEKVFAQYSVKIVDHLATDGLSHTLSDEVDRLDDASYELYCQYHYDTCRQPSLLGISAHGLLIAKKQ